jgi:TRAP transporter TAXI family solute receptor
VGAGTPARILRGDPDVRALAAVPRLHIRAIRDRPRGSRFHAGVQAIAAAAIAAAALAVVIVLLLPLPPRTVIMATGLEGGAYQEVGKRYRDLLALHGVTLELLPTAGALENLARLRDPQSRVTVGLLQSGITSARESPELESLGTVFYEVLWLFHRGPMDDRGVERLRGRKISVGPEGSGTRALALELLARHGVDAHFAQLLPLTHQEAGDRLLRGEIDAALMLAGWDSPVVRRLLADETIELVSFPRAGAYVALYPFLNKLTVPAGMGDIARNRPRKDVAVFATKASLVVRKDLHPAIQSLLLDAAEQIHSAPAIFQRPGQFPAAESIDLPLSDTARQFYRSGPPFLQRHLPFWLAAVFGRILVLLIPLVGVIYPLFWIMPALYGWRIRHRIDRIYSDLRLLERKADSPEPERPMDELHQELDQLEDRASHLQVPLSYTELVYTLREHIALVRERLARGDAPSPEG